jgi:hypothetical protein
MKNREINAMKFLNIFLACIIMGSMALAVHALERSVPLPYQYGVASCASKIPNCNEDQYVGVSNTQLVCKSFKPCPAGEYVASISGTTPICKSFQTVKYQTQAIYTICPLGQNGNCRGDAVTIEKVCQMQGFTGQSGWQDRSWKSPKNNSYGYWDKSAEMWRQGNGGSFNHYVTDATCYKLIAE